MKTSILFLLLTALFAYEVHAQHHHRRGHQRGAGQQATVSGKISSAEGEIIDYAGVYLKGTSYGAYTNEKGTYQFQAPAGEYTLVVSAIGYQEVQKKLR